MPNRIAKRLKAIDSFAGRLVERRRLGGDDEAIAVYAYQMVVNKRTNHRLRLDVDETSLPSLLTADEHAVYRRLVAAEWARTQRKVLAAKAADENAKKSLARAEMQMQRAAEKRKDQADIRQRLLAQGAVTVRKVAQCLGVSVAEVRSLHETGHLPSDGFVPIQYSRGRSVHLWFPKTILRYLNGWR